MVVDLESSEVLEEYVVLNPNPERVVTLQSTVLVILFLVAVAVDVVEQLLPLLRLHHYHILVHVVEIDRVESIEDKPAHVRTESCRDHRVLLRDDDQ